MTCEAKDGTVRISNAVEDGTLLQVFVSHDSGVSLGPASPDELAPPKTTRSKSLTTEGIPSEIFNSESHQKVSDKGHVLEQEFVMNRIVNHAFENGSYFFRVRWYGYISDDDTWKPTEHLPRNHIVTYFRQRNLRLPIDRALSKAMSG